MIRVAFWFDAPIEYSGGLNYIKNLLYALSLVNDGSVQPYVFFSHDVPRDLEQQFSPFAKVVRTRLLQRRTLTWLAHKILYKAFGSMALVNALLKSHGISIVSHVWFVYKGSPPFKIIAWIPDFQYLHLPDLFPDLDPAKETRIQQKVIAQSDLVILSSNNAYADFKRVALSDHVARGMVLKFVSQAAVFSGSVQQSLSAAEEKYGFKGKYFFLPNQFWAHKNHLIVLQAVDQLKRSGINVQVLCTGNTKDYRVSGTAYVDELHSFIAANGLENHVRILGLIDHRDVLLLMRYAVAVINPSRFEGWSSSVEEAKSMGKHILLSRIGTHIEQAPPKGRYFDPDDVVGLSEAIARVWDESVGAESEETQHAARDALRERTMEFGTSYLRLVQGVNAGNKGCSELRVNKQTS